MADRIISTHDRLSELEDRVAELEAELLIVRGINAGLAERVVEQSHLLSRKAEKPRRPYQQEAIDFIRGGLADPRD